jgi:hypothetical protein
MTATVSGNTDAVHVMLTAADDSLVKELRISQDGGIEIHWRWAPTSGWFATELSLAAPLPIVAEPVARLVSSPIETVSKSEKGFDRTRQGESLTFIWPAALGAARLIISPAS